MGGFLSGRTSLTTVQTADIADDAITEAKVATDAIGITELKAGTDGNIISYDASGNPVAIATGSDGQVLTSAGAGAPPAFEAAGGGWTLGTEVASTSGTAVTFTGIPSGTKRVTINFVGVSQGSASQTMQLQIGDSGGIETSAYTSCRWGVGDEAVLTTYRATDKFGIYDQTGLQAADALDGIIELVLEDSSAFQWNCTSNLACTNRDGGMVQAGSKALSAELTQFKIFTNGGATFDAGAVNVMYHS